MTIQTLEPVQGLEPTANNTSGASHHHHQSRALSGRNGPRAVLGSQRVRMQRQGRETSQAPQPLRRRRAAALGRSGGLLHPRSKGPMRIRGALSRILGDVAQTSGLPYRRPPACRGYEAEYVGEIQDPSASSTPCRLEVCDTADRRSALPTIRECARSGGERPCRVDDTVRDSSQATNWIGEIERRIGCSWLK
jgi:hypothetical protein